MKAITIEMTPTAKGKQLVRFSQPFPKGFLKKGDPLEIYDRVNGYEPSLRVLTTYSDSEYIRCAVITFLYEFKNIEPIKFELVNAEERSPNTDAHVNKSNFPIDLIVDSTSVTIYHGDTKTITAALVAPSLESGITPEIVVVEQNDHYMWKNFYFDDRFFPRTIEVRASIDGTVTVNCHIQRKLDRDSFAPELGWDFNIEEPVIRAVSSTNIQGSPEKRLFTEGGDYDVLFAVNKAGFKLYFPLASSQRKGYIAEDGNIRYRRATSEEMVPMQPQSFRRFAFTVSQEDTPRLNNMFLGDIKVDNDTNLWQKLYPDMEENSNIEDFPLISEVTELTYNYIDLMSAKGDDFGNITNYDVITKKNTGFGMNRFNHVSDYFYLGLSRKDSKLINAAVAYSYNFCDLTIWWGDYKYGGTRYPYIFRGEKQERAQSPYSGTDFLWRGNEAGGSFCHKGFSNFFIAYEQTGDPLMLKALNAQIDYAIKHVRVEINYTRNVGVVRDFSLLYDWTGEEIYLKKAIEMFESYKTFINEDGLFAENGQIVRYDEPFINDDSVGGAYAYAKPYILGYALSGLTALYRIRPNLTGLKKAITDVGLFMAKTQDDCGTFRYPHPMSGRAVLRIESVGFLLEVLNTIDDLEDGVKTLLLNSVENTLKAILAVYKKTGKIGIKVTAWEVASGRSDLENIHRLYEKPTDRDKNMDFIEGEVSVEQLSPETILRWQYTLNCYSKWRDLDRLIAPVKEGSQFEKLVTLADIALNKDSNAGYEKPGVVHGGPTQRFPAFYIKLKKDIKFELARRNNLDMSFEDWKERARNKVIESYMEQPAKADFEPVIAAEEDRGDYVARKIVINITEYSRINTYMLIPKGRGPFPAILLLHDHGAKFDIGKEKVIRPFDVTKDVIESANKWVEECYGGRYIGDELAKRGYVCFATDMLNWSERGFAGYENTHVLDGNMQFLGSSFSGHIMNEDLNAADYLASQPFVDPSRVGAMGLSVGAYRTWHVSSISDKISVGAAICWLSTIKWQMAPDINLAGGQANTMLHPGLYNYLDIPDVASIACPKPMLFFNGYQDGLFPIPSVREAYSLLRDVWKEQGVEDRLYTKLWDVPHLFNEEMQEDAFNWLNKWLQTRAG